MAKGEILLGAEGIRKDYIRKGNGTNIFTAVSETDISLKGGELHVVTGRSGSGKTTLVNMLATLLEPSAGLVMYREKTDLYGLDDEERSRVRNEHFGYIPQDSVLMGTLTVRENILLPFTLYGEKGDEKKADELMGALDISHLRDIRPGELSGGELRRVSIARALIRDAEIIFADEPTGDLDDDNTKAVLGLLRDKADKGAAVFIVTHDAEAAGFADHVHRMDGGILE